MKNKKTLKEDIKENGILKYVVGIFLILFLASIPAGSWEEGSEAFSIFLIGIILLLIYERTLATSGKVDYRDKIIYEYDWIKLSEDNLEKGGMNDLVSDKELEGWEIMSITHNEDIKKLVLVLRREYKENRL